MNAACVPIEKRYLLWPECIVTMAKLHWLDVIEIKGVTKTRVEHYQGSVPKFAQNLRTWGEAGTVKLGKQGKIIDRGVTMMFIGYANNHDGDCFRMFNPVTNGVSETLDVIWLRRMFYEKQDADATKQEPIVFLEETRSPEERESSQDSKSEGDTLKKE